MDCSQNVCLPHRRKCEVFNRWLYFLGVKMPLWATLLDAVRKRPLQSIALKM